MSIILEHISVTCTDYLWRFMEYRYFTKGEKTKTLSWKDVSTSNSLSSLVMPDKDSIPRTYRQKILENLLTLTV